MPSSRAVVIEQLVHYIRVQQLHEANRLIRYFQDHGEQISREILSAYQHSTHGCQEYRL